MKVRASERVKVLTKRKFLDGIEYSSVGGLIMILKSAFKCYMYKLVCISDGMTSSRGTVVIPVLLSDSPLELLFKPDPLVGENF